MRWTGHTAQIRQKRKSRLLVGHTEGERPLRKPRRRWFNNIEMDLVKTGWCVVDMLRILISGELM
jgi:hypothetical protein